MNSERAILTRLLAIPSVTALVGQRIYQLLFPQSTEWPAVRIHLIDEVEVYDLAGSKRDFRARVQVDAVDYHAPGTNPYKSAVALAEAINGDGQGENATGLSGWRGRIGAPPYWVKGVFRVDRDVRYDAEEQRLVRVRQDYEVISSPSV